MNTPNSISARLIPILDVFAANFHQEFSQEHRVASPLGAWCLLAFIAANDENPRKEVIDNLGCSTQEAKEILLTLLKDKPEVVSLAVNSWLNPSIAGSSTFSQWVQDVTDIAKPSIRIPDSKELNEWVDKKSLGLITEFPVTINPDDFLALFATVVATDISWKAPFKVISVEEMTEAWSVKNILLENDANNSYVHDDPTYGKFGVHCGTTAENDLNVYSVIAFDENVSEETTMAIARSIAGGWYRKVVNTDLPVGDSYNGTLTVTENPKSFTPDDTVQSYLPAWKTSNKFDLKDSGLGFEESISRFSETGGDVDFKVQQVAVAEYNALGFKAAALTFGIMARSAMPMYQYENRNVVIRFNRPFAVIATVNTSDPVWNRVPVFDGWITEAVEAEVPKKS